jgi:hypothetical protein
MQYVEADVTLNTPDPGSKPWLLAEAASSKPPETEVPANGTGKIGQQQAVLSPTNTLPEDRFLEADALSSHFLRLREEEKAAREAEKRPDAGEGEGVKPDPKSVTPATIIPTTVHPPSMEPNSGGSSSYSLAEAAAQLQATRDVLTSSTRIINVHELPMIASGWLFAAVKDGDLVYEATNLALDE